MTDQPKTKENLYHLILGLPEEITSPNYYELLGLEARTTDPQVIKNAAADQNRKLLSWQNSDRYAAVRALTFEVVQARDTLLNPESRAAYNANLGNWGPGDAGPWIVEEPQPRSPEPLSVRCPDCEAEFKLRNRDLVGRRIPCPDCGFRFTVQPEPEAVVLVAERVVEEQDSDAELKALDNFEDMEDLPAHRKVFEVEPLGEDFDEEYADYESISRPPSRSRNRRRNRSAAIPPPQPSRPASRSSDSRSPQRWVVLGGGALMVAGLVILVAVFIQRLVSPSNSKSSERLAYLPPDCQSVAYYRMGDVARTPAFQHHLTNNSRWREAVDQFRERVGMELHDLESISIGVREGHLTWFQAAGFLDRRGPDLAFVAVARSTKDWDRSKLIGNHTQSATHNGETYHTFSLSDQAPTKWALYLADARTVLFGSEAEVQAAMDSKGSTPNWADAEFLQQEYAIVWARLPGPHPLTGPGPGPRPPVSTRLNGAEGQHLGSGILLAGNEIQNVTFLAWNSEADAANYVALGPETEQRLRETRPPRPGNSGPPDLRFHHYGRTVAIIEDNQTETFDYGNTASLYAPLEMLARLGPGPRQQAAVRSEPQPQAAVNFPPNNPEPNNPLPNPAAQPPTDHNGLAPPPDAQMLDALIADLQTNRRWKQAARELAKREPVPARQQEVARLLENMIRNGGHFDKQAAADALGVWGSSENVPFLIRLLDGEDVFLKRHVLPALGRLKDPRALPVLVESLQNIHVLSGAQSGLELFGSAAEPELLNALANGDWQQQQRICQILRKVGTRRSLPQLDALAGRGSIHVRPHAQTAAHAIRIENR